MPDLQTVSNALQRKTIINQITKKKRKANTLLKRNNCQFFFGKFSLVRTQADF